MHFFGLNFPHLNAVWWVHWKKKKKRKSMQNAPLHTKSFPKEQERETANHIWQMLVTLPNTLLAGAKPKRQSGSPYNIAASVVSASRQRCCSILWYIHTHTTSNCIFCCCSCQGKSILEINKILFTCRKCIFKIAINNFTEQSTVIYILVAYLVCHTELAIS